MVTQFYRYVKDIRKLFVIYLDILGFGIPIREEAKRLHVTDQEIRKLWREKTEVILKDLKRNKFLITFEKISPDSWVTFTKAADDVYYVINALIEVEHPFEVAIEFEDFRKKGNIIDSDEIMRFLKSNIMGNYKELFKKAYGTSIKETFILATEKAFNGLGSDKCWSKPHAETKYYLFVKDKGKDNGFKAYNISDKRKIIEIDRISAKKFFGRKKEINQACKRLKEYSFAIVGIQGIGKSKLASGLFERAIENREFKMYYWRRFTYGTPPSFSDFGKRLFKDLTNEDIDFGRSKKVDEQVEVCEQVQLVINTMKAKRCLLVIDQFEAVIDRKTRRPKDQGFAELLKHAREGMGTARLVVTAWEVPKDSEGLQFPHLLVEGVDESAGIEIIRNEIPKGNRQAIEESIEDIKRLIERIEGHPLGLQMIAQELIAQNYSPKHIEEIIGDSELWKGTLRDIATKIVSKVYTRISQNPELEKVLSAVCIFSRPCDISAISFVTTMPKSDIIQVLKELSRRCLVSILQGGNYCVHHDLIREYVLMSHLSLKRKVYLHSKAADYYRKQPYPPPENRKSIGDVYSLLDAINHLISADNPKEAGELFIEEKLHDNLYSWSYLEELKLIYKRFEKNDKDIPKNMLSVFLGNLGLVLRDLGNLPEAKKYYDKALIVARDCQNKNSECTQLVNLGDVYHFLGEIDTSIEYHNQAKKLFKDIKERKLEARNFGCLGNALRAKGDLEKAEEYYNQAIIICRELEVGDRRYEGVWLGDLGYVYADKGELLKAVECYNHAYAIAVETGDRRHESWWLGVLGSQYYELGHSSKAIGLLKEALSISKSVVFRRGIYSQLRSLGNIYWSSAEFLDAIKYYKEAMNISKEMKHPENEISVLWHIGILYFDLCKFHQSIKYFENALNIARKMNNRQDESKILSKIGESYSELSQFNKAIEYLSKALKIAKEDENIWDESTYISILGDVYIKCDQFTEAVECFIRAKNIAKEIGDEQYEDSVQSFFKEKIEQLNKKNKKIKSLSDELIKAKDRDPTEGMKCLNNLGDIYTLLGQFKKAEEYYHSALKIG